MAWIAGLDHPELELWLQHQGYALLPIKTMRNLAFQLEQHEGLEGAILGTWLRGAELLRQPEVWRVLRALPRVIILAPDALRDAESLDRAVLAQALREGITDVLPIWPDEAGLNLERLGELLHAPQPEWAIADWYELCGLPRPATPPRPRLVREADGGPAAPRPALVGANAPDVAPTGLVIGNTATWPAPDDAPVPPSPTPMPRTAGGVVVSIAGFKGGVGKTTAAANCAIQARAAGLRVLAMDFNFGTPALARHLGVPLLDHRRRPVEGLGYFVSHGLPDSLHDIAFPTKAGVEVLGGAPAELRIRFSPEEPFLEALIAQAKSQYDVVVIDTSQALDDLGTYVALVNAQAILFVADQDMAALTEIRDIMELARRAGIRNDLFHLIINRYRPPKADMPSQGDIERYLGLRAALVVPDQRDLYVTSINRGSPASLNGAKEWQTLVSQLLPQATEPAKVDRRRGWLARLWRH